MNASRSRWAVSMPACTLNTNGAERRRSTSRGSPSTSGAGARRRRQRRPACRAAGATPKLSIADANSTGDVCPARNISWSWSPPVADEQFDSPRPPSPSRRPRVGRGGGRRQDSSGAMRRPARGAGEADVCGAPLGAVAARRGSRRRSRPARSAASAAARSGRWISSSSSSGVAARAVPLVDDGDHRDAAVPADLGTASGSAAPGPWPRRSASPRSRPRPAPGRCPPRSRRGPGCRPG